MSRRVITAVACVIALAVGVAVWIRMHYGVDFTDEAFYLAMPLRFVLGDRPFVDELNIAQTAGVVVWPFVAAFYKLNHGTEGIMLAARTLLLLLQAGVGVVVFRSLRRSVGDPVAILIGASCVLFWPINLPGLSYNTLGGAFFTIGLVLPLRELLEDRPPPARPLFLAGAAHALASFCYPTLLLPVLSFALALMWQHRKSNRWLAYVAGGVAMGLVLAVPLLRAGRSGLRNMIAYSFAGGLGGGDKLKGVVLDLWFAMPGSSWIFVAVLFATALLSRHRGPSAALAALLLPPLACASAWIGVIRSSGFVVYWALFALPLGWALDDRAFAGRILRWLWLPSAIAGLVTGWTSTNRGIASAIGLFPGSLATSVLAARIVAERWPAARRYGLNAAAALAPLGVLLFFLYDGACLYRDGPTLADLKVRVTHGPYRGLRTAREKLAMLDEIDREVGHRTRRGGMALFYGGEFPAGYLITSMRPAVASAWIFPNPGRLEIDAEFFDRRVTSRVLVVKFVERVAPLAWRRLDNMVERKCVHVSTQGDFDVWEERH
jgi:hypothetical protein